MFAITMGKGFQMTFKNGYTVSVQFGTGNYCENQRVLPSKAPPPSPTAEIACWGADGKFVSCGGDDVRGWVSADSVATFISWVAAIDPANPPKLVPAF